MKSLATAAVLTFVLVIPAPSARADFSQDFQTGTSDWAPGDTSDTVNQEPDGYVSPDYASGITSASPTEHARLRRGECTVDPSGGGGPSVMCNGAFTRWGGYNSVWMGGYTTQVDVYLDVAYAKANPDSYAGNIACLTANAMDTSCNGTRFDFSSALNDSGGNFLQDYVFNVGTGDPAQPNPCSSPSGGFVVAASTNAFRSGASPYDLGHDPFCVATSGWYTFKHTFKDVGGSLQVLMEIFPAGERRSSAFVDDHARAPDHRCRLQPLRVVRQSGDMGIRDRQQHHGWVWHGPLTTTDLDHHHHHHELSHITPTTTTLPLDHFQCYEIKPKAFASITGVSVQDQFGQHTETVRFPHRLCAPADKRGEEPTAPNHPEHLHWPPGLRAPT